MRFEISNQLSGWLRKDGRDDLASQGEVDLPELAYLAIFSEARQQHPQEDMAATRDRALFRVLTHPELAPTRKQVRKVSWERREEWLRWAWMIAVLILLLLLAVRGHAQEKPKVIYEAQQGEGLTAAAAPPSLTDAQKFKVRDLQHRYDELRVQAAKLDVEKLKLEKQISDVLFQINGLAFDLAKESKVNTNQYNLNIDLLQWEKRK